MANSGPRTNTSQFFFTFRPCPHLDGKHTVFGKLVGGEDVFARIEKVPVLPGSGVEKPAKDIIITSVQILTDPFEAYQVRLKAKLERQDQSDAAVKLRAEKAKEREKDRTTWLGTDLGERGEAKEERERKRKEREEGGVGKYLAGTGGGAGGVGGKGGVEGTRIPQVPVHVALPGTKKKATGTEPVKPAFPQTLEYGADKKKRKGGGGGFGDFSAW